MWISCCGCKKSRSKESKNNGMTTIQEDPLKIANTHQSLKETTAANGGHVRGERRSLPDVVLLSTGLSAGTYLANPRPSLQLDSETGRRPTLVVETTAQLAESESTGLGDKSESSHLMVPNLDYFLRGGRQLRSHSLDYTSPTRVRPQPTNKLEPVNKNSAISLNMTEKSQWKRPPHRSVFYRLVSLRTIRNPFRRKSATSFNSAVGNQVAQLVDHDEQTNSGKKEATEISPTGSGCLIATGDTYKVDVPQITMHSLNVGRLPLIRSSQNPRRGSLCLFSLVDEPIVTPFAQLLASLRRVRYNFIQLTNATSSRDSRFGTSHTNLEDSQTLSYIPGHQEQPKISATETLAELEWCLDRLENIQTHRSVSDMATSKFRKMLSKELSQVTDGSRNSKQISEYICSTFLDSNEVDTVLPAVTDTTNPDGENGTTSIEDPTRTTSVVGSTEHVPTVTESNRKPSIHDATDSQSTADSLHSSLQTIPPNLTPFGVLANSPDELNRTLTHDLDLWGMDVFELARLTPNPLTCLFYRITQTRGLLKRFSISEMKLIRYMNLVEENYRNVPYHNRIHAADVLQSTHVLLNAKALETVFTDLEILTVLFACAIHDVDHPGTTNPFLINTNDQLAILYNDTSVLENHHLAVGFQLLSRPGCDLFEHIPKKQRLSLRRMTIDMVLATDMSKHMSLLADLKTMVETKKVAGSGILTLDNYSDRIQILQSMVHCADLSNPTKPLDLYRKWTARVMEELFRQGDQERSRGLEISPMCDRTTASIEKTQISFIDFIVHPLWETWSDLVHPDAQDILDRLDDNREWYLNQITEEAPGSETASASKEPTTGQTPV